MYDNERTLYAYMLQVAEKMAADIDESKMLHQPAPNVNPPMWILGHLAIATDYAASCVGLPKACPKEWHAAFGPGSQPIPPANARPTKAELMTALRNGHERVSAASANPDPAILAKPQPIPFMSDTPIKTVGDLLSHLMTTHAATHLGQLSYWRRLQGAKPMI